MSEQNSRHDQTGTLISIDTDNHTPPRYNWALWSTICLAVLLLAAVANFAYITHNCPLDLSGDEAYYRQWARHLDLSYYCEPPMVAYIIAGSTSLLSNWSIHSVGTEMLAVRLPAILLSVLTGFGIFMVARAITASPAVALTAVGLTFTIPIFVAGSVLMTIDAPLVCAWTWCLACTARAIRTGHTAWWAAAGLLLALGVLSKFMMVLLPLALLATLLLSRTGRAHFTKPGFYLAAVLGMLGFLPILLWNMLNGWVTFRHMADQAGGGNKFVVNPGGVLAYLSGQAAVVNPVWFVVIILAIITYWRSERRKQTDVDLATDLVAWAAIVPWTAFLAFSPITDVQANWPVVAVIGGTVLLARWLVTWVRQSRPTSRRLQTVVIGTGILIGLAAVVASHRSDWMMPVFSYLARNSPPWDLTPTAKYDPASRLRGWAQLGQEVGAVLKAERAAGRDPFIVTDGYQVSAEIAFYCPEPAEVYCIQTALGARMCQYDFWPGPLTQPDKFIGRPCIYIGLLEPRLTGQGQSRPPAMPNLQKARTVEHRVAGQLVCLWTIFICDAYAGFGPAKVEAQRY